MKSVFILLGVVALALMGIAGARGDGSLTAGLKSAGSQTLVFLPIIATALVIAGLIEALLPQKMVEVWLSDASGWRGIAVAWLAGALTPAGSIVGLPLAAGLYRAGVGGGVLVTYLTSLATLSIIRIPLEVGLIGGRLAALRVLACLFLPPIAGLLARAIAPWVLGRG